ncbi:unnamed protein product [Didymodactylos carnosus]|uniref:Uncharacterized protein n=1 Tax=Didymodactylos carnosus TaxID=1234261 RepID=A0A815EMQ2_9BILA|nr:unnamed protein product [Didymodactylos carnosus]CAF4151310.1 unnamed protein product [Didymodactylos carnosus]
MYVKCVFLALIFVSGSSSVSIGHIAEASLISSIYTTKSFNHNTLLNQCICYGITGNYSALNVFLSNDSCQFFVNMTLPLNIVINRSSTLYLLKPLPDSTVVPCCSNFTWLLNEIKSTVPTILSVNVPNALAMNDQNQLALIYNGIYLRLMYANLTTISTVNVPYNAYPLSYSNGYFFVGIYPIVSPYTLYMYSSTNLTQIVSRTNPYGGPQRGTFLENNTILCIETQNVPNSTILFYKWTSSSNFTLYRTISMPITNAYGLAKMNDEYLLIANTKVTGSVYKLSIVNGTYTTFVATTGSQYPMSVVIDNCGRIWIPITSYGLKIYDSTGLLLGTWTESTSLYDLVVTPNYDIYFIDQNANKLYYYQMNKICTS